MFSLFRKFAAFAVLLLVLPASPVVLAEDEESAAGPTPPRLSLVEGEVSFWRAGADEWVNARVNTPMVAGDGLYADTGADFELQLGSRAFVRAAGNTQLTLVSQEHDYLQLKVTSGQVSLDLRALKGGYTVEVDTPNAVFSIDHPGYYRVDVNNEVHFITRRGGRALVIPDGGEAMSILPSEEIVVFANPMRVETYAAMAPDRWDRWNFDRTDDLMDSVSARYLPEGVAGADELDRYGSWRVVGEYGPVWVPDDVPVAWAPYSNGSWVWDPYYEWTWIDDAPWGWAPFHYGRWVNISGYWAWAPGPVVVRYPVYAPALVAFFDIGDNVSVGIGLGTPGLGWVALSWGEPLVPWWGHHRFRGRPWWGGWGGPRVVNNVVVKNTTIINITNINYRNTYVSRAVVTAPRDQFGRRHMAQAQYRLDGGRGLKPLPGVLPVRAGPASLVAGARVVKRPPERVLERRVVSIRPIREHKVPWRAEPVRPDVPNAPVPRYVPQPNRSWTQLPRPQFGTQAGPERARPPLPPRYEERRRLGEPTPTGVTREIREQPRPGPVPPTGVPPTRVAPPPAPPSAPPAVRQPTPPQVPPAPPSREMREIRPGQAAPAAPGAAPQQARERERVDGQSGPLPGKPANRTYRRQPQQQGGEAEEQGRRPR